MTPHQEKLALAFSRVEELAARLQALTLRGPEPDSQAARDGRPWLGRMAWDLGTTALAIGIDHLRAWARLGTQPQPAFAHMTLIRSATEAAVLARWLCDPTISADERLARGAGAQLADYRERAKFERGGAGTALPESKHGKPAEERIKEVLASLERRSLRERPLPSTVILFDRYAQSAGGSMLYRVLSAFAHGKQWAVLPTSSHEMVLADSSDFRSEHLARVTSDDAATLALTQAGVRLTDQAIADLERYSTAPVMGEPSTL